MAAHAGRSKPRARLLLAELAKRTAFPRAVQKYSAGLFRHQKQVLAADPRFAAVHAGRRSGKTHLGRVRAVIAAAEHPGSFVPIFERTSTCAAARVMWRGLKRDSDQYGLGLKFGEVLKIADCPNGSRIGIIGVDKLDELEKARGDAWPFALVDEAGGFRPYVLAGLNRDVIRPALTDMRGSQWQIGTPNPTCSGPFHDACTNDDNAYEVFSWDMRDNPHIPDAVGEMRAVRKEYGWTETDPTYRREWLGEWCFSFDAQVYAYDRDRNDCDIVPDTLEQYVVGIDLGFIDSTAVVVLGFHGGSDPRIWVVESYKEAKLIPSAVGELVQEYVQEYDPIAIVGDTGGLGRSLVEEMRQRFGIPIKAAEKTKKLAFIELLNGDMRSGRMQIQSQSNEDLITELRLLQWEPDSRLPGRRWRVSQACDDHLTDAMLYAWREAKHWISETLPEKPVAPGHPAFEDQLEAEMEEAFRRSHQAEDSDEEWDTLHQDADRDYEPWDDDDDPLIAGL